MGHDEERYLSAREIAQKAGLSYETVRRRFAKGMKGLMNYGTGKRPTWRIRWTDWVAAFEVRQQSDDGDRPTTS